MFPCLVFLPPPLSIYANATTTGLSGVSGRDTLGESPVNR